MDGWGRITQIRFSNGVSEGYEYTPSGQVSRAIDGNGNSIQYQYNSLGKVRIRTDQLGYIEEFQYDGEGNIRLYVDWNGNRVYRIYNVFGNLVYEKAEDPEGKDPVSTTFRYEYDGNGNRTAKYGEQAMAYGGKQKVRTSYRYDIRGQLVEEKEHDSPTSYTYDAAGNRTGKKTPERVTRYSYNGKNQLTEDTWDTGKNNFTYDRQGSILEMAGTEGNRRFTYNSKNQQLKVDCEDGRSQEDLYDAEGLRYGVKEEGTSTRFVYHRGEPLYERSDEKEISYHLGSGIEAAQTGGELYYHHQDEQLSTALLTDRVGKVRNHYRYSAFGEMLEGSESVGNRIRYTGQQYDEISGQYYLRARYYNPVVGRFLQEDVYQGDGLNLYAYCGINPVRYYDPSGYTSTGTGGYEAGEIGEVDRIGDFTDLEGSTVDEILDRIPDEAILRDLHPVSGGATEGFEFKWSQNGLTYRLRVHNAVPGAPEGSNAVNGWGVRIQRGKQYYDPTINDFQPAKYTNPKGDFFNEGVMNNTHIPIKDPYSS